MEKSPVGDFFGVLIFLYAPEEDWPWKRTTEGVFIIVGGYLPTIHIQKDTSAGVFTVVMHEFVHYLQYLASTSGEVTPLGLGIGTPQWIKEVYPPEYWEIEAEAHWLQSRHDQIGLLAEKIIDLN